MCARSVVTPVTLPSIASFHSATSITQWTHPPGCASTTSSTAFRTFRSSAAVATGGRATPSGWRGRTSLRATHSDMKRSDWLSGSKYRRKLLAAAKEVLGAKCFYCGERDGDTLDHLLPRSLGGRTALENSVPCCDPCNVAKKNRLPTTNEMARHRAAWRNHKSKP